MTRRAEVREETESAIRRAAREELRAHGPRELSLRNVARRVGMSPAGLYRYVDGRDGLLTGLITESLYELAGAVGTAIAGADEIAEQVVAGFMAYRDWSMANPAEFNLCFGEPLPGYAAPEGGATTEAFQAVFAPLLGVLAAANGAGLVVSPELPDDLAPLRVVSEMMLPDSPPGLVTLAFETWARVHGITALEVNDHLSYLGFDTRPMAEFQVRRMVAHLMGDTIAP
jgi:AcrR family transcriptional regulator